MTARITEPATNKARMKQLYAAAHSRHELHSMLDTLIDSGRQWLVELHFSAWVPRCPEVATDEAADDLVESAEPF